MTWFDILTIITKLTRLDELTIDTSSKALESNFDRFGANRFRSEALPAPFKYAEFLPGSDRTILILYLRDDSPREEYVLRMLGLGKPIDIELVSPPVADGDELRGNVGWDRKYRLCYEVGDRHIWFGIEESSSRKKLVSVSVQNEGFKSDAVARE